MVWPFSATADALQRIQFAQRQQATILEDISFVVYKIDERLKANAKFRKAIADLSKASDALEAAVKANQAR